MLTIDSQIWIYYLDVNAKEHKNVVSWLNGENNNGVLFKEKIILSSIIPLELAHNFFKTAITRKTLDKDKVEEMIFSLISLENCQLIDIDQFLIFESIKKLKQYGSMGIGGRDALILTTMDQFNVQTIVTHDKNILSLKQIRRIDPVFATPFILEIGDEFDYKDFKQRILDL
jgi:predicted nucleic acid-binding protein